MTSQPPPSPFALSAMGGLPPGAGAQPVGGAQGGGFSLGGGQPGGVGGGISLGMPPGAGAPPGQGGMTRTNVNDPNHNRAAPWWPNSQPDSFYPAGPGAGGNLISSGPLQTSPSNPMTAAPNDHFSRPTSAMDVYRSSVPVMQDAMKTAVGGAMGEAGFGGNRFGSYAMDRAAQEGSRAGLQQNQLMSDLLYRQTNADQDRSLQAAGMGMQHGIAQNQMELDRMRHLADVGRWEQGRQDDFGRLSYEDFERNKQGFLPMLMQLAMSPGTATSPTWATQQNGGSPGAIDYLSVLAQIYGAYQGGR
jgi:hypothetical protein